MSSSPVLRESRTYAFARRLAAPLLLILASLVFVVANAPAHTQMSLFDEYVYIDYLAKFPEEGVVRQGEMTGELARQYYSCEGVSPFGKIAPQNCSTHDFSNDVEYPMGGKTSADLYTPLYFGVTWLAAQPFLWFGSADIVEAGRLAGTVWLASASVLLYYAMKRLRVSTITSLAGCGLLIASAAAWWSTTFISTDGSAMTAGAALLLTGLRYLQTGRGAWMLPALSVLAVAFKFQNFMAVVAAAGFLLLTSIGQKRSVHDRPALEQPRTTWRKLVLILGSMFMLPLLFQVCWMLLRSAIAVSAFPDQGVASHLGPAELIMETLKFYGRLGLGFTIPDTATVGYVLAMLATWTIIIGVFAPIAMEPRFSPRYSLGVATFLTLLAAGPALAIANRLTQGYYFSLPPRYGLSLLPLALALVAVTFDRKIETRIPLLALAGVTFAASLTPYFPGNIFG